MKNFTDYYNNMKQGERKVLAEQLGKHPTYLHQLARCERYPSLDLALRIQILTGVDVNTWGLRCRWLK